MFLLALAAIVACNYLIDAQAALIIQRVLYGNRYWVEATGNIPDLLLPAVSCIALSGWMIYLVRKRSGLHDALTDLALVVSWSLPTSYICKTLLKFVFGRVNTRQWLLDSSLYGFHWFHGTGVFNGFPSGHMVVFTTFASALWRIYPRYRGFYAGVLLLLGVALIATNYHFVSDVIAGAVVGIMVEAAVVNLLRRRQLLHIS